MKSREYLEEIRKTEGLKNAVLSKIEVDGTKITFRLLTDCSYGDEDIAHARSVSARFVPAGYVADVRVMKSVPNPEVVKTFLLGELKKKYPAAAAFVSPEDVLVEAGKGGGRFSVGTAAIDRISPEVVDALCFETGKNFCGNWTGEFVAVKKDLGDVVPVEAPVEYLVGPRFFPITEYVPIDGANPKRAIYIADLNKEMTDVAVCGAVTYLEERTTKNGKPFLSLTISDGTAQLRSAYFTRKATLEKARQVKQGDYICLSGDNEVFNGALSFRAKYLDFGRPPVGFVPEARPSRPVPAQYKAVFPVPAVDYVQAELFTHEEYPAEFERLDFVVFDLETTGLSNSNPDHMDRIIEVGAVKISGGKITEKFSSFVACPVKLTDEIISLTGITDDMLRGAPDVKDVIADFFKFAAGCVLVGHNVQFDYKFIRHYGEKEGYLFEQRQYDTVTFAQEMLRLSNYKLNTVADYFGFAFNHHRAYDDAFVTAKIFKELVRLKGGLPK